MLRITTSAITHLLRLRRERGFDPSYGARLARGAGSARARLSFVAGPQPADRVLAQAAGSIAVYIDPGIERAFGDATIDAVQADGAVRWKITPRPR